MLNFDVGSSLSHEGRAAILTRPGARGCALYGPYVDVAPGRYRVSFSVHLAEPALAQVDALCAFIDVAADTGNRIVTSDFVSRSELAGGIIELDFTLAAAETLEFRVWVNGATALIVEDRASLAPVDENSPSRVRRERPEFDGQLSADFLRGCFREGLPVGFVGGNAVIPVAELQRLADIGSRYDRSGDKPLAAFLADRFQGRPENDYYEALYGDSRSLRGKAGEVGLTSAVCQQIHFSLDECRYWLGQMHRRPRMHRKEWELFYIAQALHERGMLQPGKRGLGFAVGVEPLPALFAARGCTILATDQSPEQAIASGWMARKQYSSQVDSLFDPHICEREKFFANVAYRSVDMNDIPADLNGSFDFCWSTCAFEHLGSLDHGMRFVENSIETLKPGGVAVHTTEFNLSSNDDTLESDWLSIYRRRDIEEMVGRLEAKGHDVSPVDWSLGKGFAETVIDLPPHRESPHLRLRVEEYDCTSIGVIVRKR